MEWFNGLSIEYKLTLIGIFATSIMSLLSLYFSVRNNKAVHYVNSVTKNRVEWIDNFRQSIAEFVASVGTECITATWYTPQEVLEINMDDKISNLRKIGSRIKLLANYGDKFDRSIIQKIDLCMLNYKNIWFKTYNCAMKEMKNNNKLYVPDDEIIDMEFSIIDITDEIIEKSQIYLKSEWNRVKYESKGKTYEKEVQEFDLKEIEAKYKNPLYRNKIWKRYLTVIKAKAKKFPPIYFALFLRRLHKEKKSKKLSQISHS